MAFADAEPDPFTVAALAFSCAEPKTSLPASAAPFTAPSAAPAKISVTTSFAFANKPLGVFGRDAEDLAFGFAFDTGFDFALVAVDLFDAGDDILLVVDFFAEDVVFFALLAVDFFAAGVVVFALLMVDFFVAGFFTDFLLY